MRLFIRNHWPLDHRKTGRIMEWPCPSVYPPWTVRSSTIAFEHDISKTAYLIDFIFWYGLNTTKTSEDIYLGHSTKIKMAATAVWRLTLYPTRMQDIVCECGSLKTACQIDFTIWYGINTTKTTDAIDLGHFSKIKMAATAVWSLTLYPMQDIVCECGSLKTACRIDFTSLYGGRYWFAAFYENQDGRHSSLKINIVPYTGYCLWTQSIENCLSDWLYILLWP